MTRHTSIVTFMETMMMLWGMYLLLMFCYDKSFLGDHHPITFLVGLGCFIGSLFMFKRQLYIASWGANIRMSIATVIVFWTPVEILGRINFFKEFWVEPEKIMRGNDTYIACVHFHLEFIFGLKEINGE